MLAFAAILAQATEVKQSPWVIVLGITVALIAMAGTILSPLLVARYMNLIRTREKADDEARRAGERLKDFERTEAVRSMAAEAAMLLKQNNAVVAETSARTQEKLDVIHGLVNSSLTAALQAQYEALRELIDLKESAGRYVSDEAHATVIELERVLAERHRQTAEAAADTTGTGGPLGPDT